MRQVGAGKRIPTTTTPFLLWHPVGDLGAVQPVAPLAPHTPWVPTFCGAYFGASDRSSCWEALYQDRAFWHIPQTSYLCRCLWLLAGSELPRTPLSGSSENSNSTTFVNRGIM